MLYLSFCARGHLYFLVKVDSSEISSLWILIKFFTKWTKAEFVQ